jgi:hypothetical protein
MAAVLAAHDYAVNDFGSAAKRDGKYLPSGEVDPGWHGCRCGEWAGYWSDFHAHVAAALVAAGFGSVAAAKAEAWNEGWEAGWDSDARNPYCVRADSTGGAS